MRIPRFFIYCLLSILIASSQASAWGPGGHKTVGAIADQMIEGTHAATEVKAILGNISLQDASVWADCVKGVNPKNDYKYEPTREYPECKIFETSQRKAEMSDFVRRNNKNCNTKPEKSSCHEEYHFTNVAIQHEKYDAKFVGTRNDDIVNAIAAATHVLKGDSAPSPFNFKDKREALLLLVHYVGDIHQPLHVGAVYLDENGKTVNPDAGAYDPKTDTHGGNYILVHGEKFHSMWDGIPKSLTASHAKPTMLKQARAIPVTTGQIYDWPIIWASDTLIEARQAFERIEFSNRRQGNWDATLPENYNKDMDTIKETQVVKAGAHLAQLLQAIWP